MSNCSGKAAGRVMARAGPGGRAPWHYGTTASGRREARQTRLSPCLPVGLFHKKRRGRGRAYAAGAPAAGSHILINTPSGVLMVLTVL